MSDDDTKRNRRDETGGSDPTIDFGDEFGVVRFADEDDSGPALSFGNETEQLPHWTEPPTGDLPRFMKGEDDDATDAPIRIGDDSTDVWGAYNDTSASRPRVDLTGKSPRFETSPPPPVQRPRREGPIRIGTDPTGENSRPIPRDPSASAGRVRPAQVTRSRRPGDPRQARPATGGMQRPASGPTAGRDLPMATAVGALLGAAFIGAVVWRPAAVVILVTAIIGIASYEFFTQIRTAHYSPVMPVGVAACVVAPLAAYWMGDAVLPLIIVFALIGCGIVFVAGDSIDISPTPQMAVTLFGIMWIGLFGSFASLILRLSTTGSFAGSNIGTDTLFIVVIGVIANDIAAYFVGSAVGRTPLRDWISPNKSTEGLIGGTLGTLGAVIIVGLQSTTWNGLGEWLALAIVIALVAPLGDLVESMIKRNLGVKDFGTILTGHGGVLDRFDSMLFTLPVVYYLALVLQPWG